MEYWDDALRERKTLNLFLPLSIPTIPLFHYSIIPLEMAMPSPSMGTPVLQQITLMNNGALFCSNAETENDHGYLRIH
jgi:hypothetical protein